MILLPLPKYSNSICGLTLLEIAMELNFLFNSIETWQKFRVSLRPNPPFPFFETSSNSKKELITDI